MGFSGLINKGANDELAELFRRQMMETAQREQQHQFDSRMAQDRAEMAQRGRLAEQELGQRQQDITLRQEAAAAPQRDPLQDYEARKQIDLRYREPEAPQRDPIADYEQRKKIDLRYREPKAAQAERDPIADYKAKKQIDAEYDAQKTATRVDKPNTYALDAANRIVSKVDALMPRIGNWTAGVQGKALASMPFNTEARNVAADIESLTASIGFDELSKMRAASPTGGALGQISDRENALLANVVASVRQDQSPANLKKNLGIVRESAARILAATQQDAGTSAAVGPMKPMSSREGGAAAPASKFTLVKQ